LTTSAATNAVVDERERSRYELRIGGELAGFTHYRRGTRLIAFTHTQIDPRFQSRGLGGQLVRSALDDARAAGLGVLPFCPFVRGYIARHVDQYVALVPENRRNAFGLPGDT
jgi:predicted GNAT family acetyltransferase